MLTRISILFSVVAGLALLFASDLLIWHVLPRRFGVAEMFAFWSGAVLSLLAIGFAVTSLIRNGKSRLSVRACTWSVTEFLAFGFVYLYGIFST